MFVTSRKIRHFYPTKFVPIRYWNLRTFNRLFLKWKFNLLRLWDQEIDYSLFILSRMSNPRNDLTLTILNIFFFNSEYWFFDSEYFFSILKFILKYLSQWPFSATIDFYNLRKFVFPCSSSISFVNNKETKKLRMSIVFTSFSQYFAGKTFADQAFRKISRK